MLDTQKATETKSKSVHMMFGELGILGSCVALLFIGM